MYDRTLSKVHQEKRQDAYEVHVHVRASVKKVRIIAAYHAAQQQHPVGLTCSPCAPIWGLHRVHRGRLHRPIPSTTLHETSQKN
jgi:hypothetical protein